MSDTVGETPSQQTTPVTGNAAVDAVLARAAGDATAPLPERYERLRGAQEALSGILDGADVLGSRP